MQGKRLQGMSNARKNILQGKDTASSGNCKVKILQGKYIVRKGYSSKGIARKGNAWKVHCKKML